LSAVAKRGHAAFVFGNLLDDLQHLVGFVLRNPTHTHH
jgi:hypothetical protein